MIAEAAKFYAGHVWASSPCFVAKNWAGDRRCLQCAQTVGKTVKTIMASLFPSVGSMPAATTPTWLVSLQTMAYTQAFGIHSLSYTMPLKPLGLWLPKQLSSTATTLLMSRRQSRWNQTSPKTDFTTIFSKCWATSMATTWAWRVHLGFVFLSGHDKNMPPILKQFKGAAESVQDEKNFRDKLSCLFDDKHVGHYETANKDFPSHLELKAAIAADKVVTLLVMDIAFLKSGGRRTQRTRTQQTRIWRTLRTRRNILANCVLNFWLHLKRNTLAVLLPRTISRVHVINWQLVALWTSWIEAKNDEDGTGCHGGGGGDDDEDAEGAPSGRAPTPPPLNCGTWNGRHLAASKARHFLGPWRRLAINVSWNENNCALGAGNRGREPW